MFTAFPIHFFIVPLLSGQPLLSGHFSKFRGTVFIFGISNHGHEKIIHEFPQAFSLGMTERIMETSPNQNGVQMLLHVQ